MELFIGFIVTVVAGTLWWGITFPRGEETPSPNNQLTLDPNTELKGFAPRYGLVAAMSNEDSYYGWFMIDHDNGGSPDRCMKPVSTRTCNRNASSGNCTAIRVPAWTIPLSGTRPYRPASRANPHWPESSPTCGSTSSPSGPCTGSTRTASHQRGHRLRAGRHRPATAGACLVRGREELQGRQRHQIRELGSTKPGAHEHQPSSLVKGSDGTPVVKMSENMATQRDNWRPRSKPITWRPNGWSAWYRADITATRMSAKPSGRAMFVS